MHRESIKVGLLILLAACPGCMSVSQAVPTRVPILVGPIDHIGGTAAPIRADQAPEFHVEDDFEIGICIATLYPTSYVVRPNAEAMPQIVEASFAQLAGSRPLGSYVPRVESLGVGAWESFITGCYGRSIWWNANGHIVEVSK